MKDLIILLMTFLFTQCQKNPSVHSQAYLDTLATDFFHRETGWIASDGAISIPLSTGKVLWLFGDSHVNDYDTATKTTPCLFQVRNCAMLQPKGDWNWQNTQTFIGTGPGFKNLFKNNPDDNYWFWPGSGFQLRDTVYVFLGNLKRTGNGAWAWGSGGPDMWEKMTMPDMKVVAYTPLQNFDSISFGAGFVKNESSGYIYAYGAKLDFISGELYVARIQMSHPNAPWQFWDGKTWNNDVTKAAGIATGESSSISVSKVGNQFLMLSSEFSVDCDMGKRIFAATSASPTGPFTANKPIYTITDTLDGHYPFFYSVTAHPEYIKNNELLVTYCINGYGKCVNICINGRSDPNYYRPRGIRIPLSILP
ncbi:MAG: hypothetical protein EPN37_01105 [Chitinophagaceae bacterium]|nr:MAG: hypothetical protein EPN37_01105 [Chitinophagaceae bacterium]